LWVPAEDLPEFNRQLTKPLAVRRAFFGPGFRGHVPERFGLRGTDAYDQVRIMIGTMDHSPFDFVMEMSANMLTFFLNFAFWKAAGAERLGVDVAQLARCLELIRNTWSQAPRPGTLVEDASITA
jgi:hypothetical protein